MIKAIVVIAVIILAFFIVQKMNTNKKDAAKNIEQGKQFLEQNKSKDGVKVTDSGLQYLVLREGTGPEQPKHNSRVEVHYHGTLINGTVFDSSVARGQSIEFGLNQVIPGWTEGLQLMKIGEKTRLFIPSNLGYGNRAAGTIPPGSVLIFEVELLAIN